MGQWVRILTVGEISDPFDPVAFVPSALRNLLVSMLNIGNNLLLPFFRSLAPPPHILLPLPLRSSVSLSGGEKLCGVGITFVEDRSAPPPRPDPHCFHCFAEPDPQHRRRRISVSLTYRLCTATALCTSRVLYLADLLRNLDKCKSVPCSISPASPPHVRGQM